MRTLEVAKALEQKIKTTGRFFALTHNYTGYQSCTGGDIGTHAENLIHYVTGLEIEKFCADMTAFVKGNPLDDIRVYGSKAGMYWKPADCRSGTPTALSRPLPICIWKHSVRTCLRPCLHFGTMSPPASCHAPPSATYWTMRRCREVSVGTASQREGEPGKTSLKNCSSLPLSIGNGSQTL